MSEVDMTRMRTVADVYPSRWLTPADLGGRAVTATIKAVKVELIRQRDGTSKTKVVLAFDRAQKEMICNVTQAKAIAALLGSDVLQNWTGKAIGLTQGSAPNGKLTIVVLAPWGGGQRPGHHSTTLGASAAHQQAPAEEQEPPAEPEDADGEDGDDGQPA